MQKEKKNIKIDCQKLKSFLISYTKIIMFMWGTNIVLTMMMIASGGGQFEQVCSKLNSIHFNKRVKEK